LCKKYNLDSKGKKKNDMVELLTPVLKKYVEEEGKKED